MADRSHHDTVPVTPAEAAERRAVDWALTTSLAGAPVDEAATVRLREHLPVAPAEPVTAETTDAMLVTTSLRLPLGTLRRLQAYAEKRGTKPGTLMREWVEQMLAAAENDHPISLQDAMRALAQLPPQQAA
ncbi:hypothetical protein HC031_20550 [Planosporangium thailandense]|uniref:Ribbon-helix-helix protein CopG domain-containing protein n=1 Tax=Planosporangium thailandense TaxID=765197 RepID=A0ABX0Y177_9ACTN|nr:hypothetical protein [Planosporangium thailandense]NJC72088.1 hypothetical protein [Planosporangium thailandense]